MTEKGDTPKITVEEAALLWEVPVLNFDLETGYPDQKFCVLYLRSSRQMAG
jgi:hypothetical protein